jgi:hypothetical protein
MADLKDQSKQIRASLLRRAADVRGQELEQGVKPAGMGVYGDDYWQRRQAEVDAWEMPARPAPAQEPAPSFEFNDGLDQWRAQGDYFTSRTNHLGDPLPHGAQGWDYYGRAYYGDGFKGWVNKIVSKLTAPIADASDQPWISTAEGNPNLPDLATSVKNLMAGEAGTAPAVAGRAAGAVIEGGLDVMGEPAKQMERSLGATAGIVEAGEGSALPELFDWLPDWAEYFANSLPLVQAYNGVRVLTNPAKDWVEKRSDVDAAYQAGRIAYSSLISPTLQAEFVRRYKAGENPYLLASELENPIAEAVGQMALDPLNVLAPLAAGAKQAGRIASVQDEFFKLAPDLDNALRSIDTVSDAGAARGLAQVVAAQISESGKVARGLDDFARKYGLSSLTADGKRFLTGRRAGELSQWIAANARTPDETIEVFRGLMLAASGDPDKVATGVAALTNFTAPQPLFSRAGQELGVMLNRMVGDNPKAFLDGLKAAGDEGLEAMTRFATEKIDDAAKGMFPSLAERVAAGEALPWHVKALVRFDKTAQDAVYRPLNTFFAGVYMGLSPGYAFRNFLTNSFHIAVDEGVGALFTRPARALLETENWLGGAVPKGVAGFGKGVQGMDTAAVGRKMPFSQLSERFEEWGSMQVVRKVVSDTMRRALAPGRALPDIRPLVDAGLDEGAARRLFGMVVENKGNVRAAATEFIGQIKKGDVEVFRTLDWMAQGDVQALHAFGVSDDVLDALRTSQTQEEALERIRAVFKGLDDEAARVVDDPHAVSEGAQGIEDVQALDEARHAQEVDAQTVEAATDYVEANFQANQAYRKALAQLSRENPQNTDLAALLERIDAQGARVAQDNAARRENLVLWRERSFRRDFNPAAAWAELGMAGPAPADAKNFRRALWDEYYFPVVRDGWQRYRDEVAEITEQAFQAVPPQDARLLEQARRTHAYAREFDNVLRQDQVRLALNKAVESGDNAQAARVLAQKYGIPTATEAGKPMDSRLLSTINKYLPEGTEKYRSLAEVPPDVAEQALRRRLAENAGVQPGTAAQAAPQAAAQVAPEAARPVPPYAGNVPTPQRVLHETAQARRELLGAIEQGLAENWGKLRPAFANRQIEGAIMKWVKAAERGVAEARLLAAGAADAARDFTMLSYPEKRGVDLALAYVFPYQFWYSRTYTNWIKRLAYNPQVAAGYARYREALAKLHAGAPEWWRYQVNTNELLGLDSENPLFFNLEATLNPLNGLTGVDFDDPQRRVNWWTALLDDMGKLGPSVWTPLNIATATALAMQGEEDAAARWGGRLIPQTATLKSALSVANINIPTRGGVNEFDPMTLIFSNGMDPYERRRVGRALGWMVERGEIDQAAAFDAAYNQTGEVWQRAAETAIRARAPGQLSSFFMGVGFKARSVSDLQIDRFYTERNRLMANEPNLSPDEYRAQWDLLRQDYPFADTVLLANKGGAARDATYAYGVIARIPPGQKNDIAEAAGISPELLDRFWSEKGHVEKWGKTDRERFMAGIVDIGAVLDLPDDATAAEWRAASNAYGDMDEAMQAQFGPGIGEMIDAYFAAEAGEKSAFLDAHPEVQEALSWKDNEIITNPLLMAYYGSAQTVERYYKGVMNAAIAQEVGEDIWDKWDTYYDIYDDDERKAYWKAHPELERYIEVKDAYTDIVAGHVTRIASVIPESRQANLRGAVPATSGEQAVAASVAQTGQDIYGMTWDDWRGMMSEPLQNIVLDYALGGEDIPERAMSQIEYIAEGLDADPDTVLAAIVRSLGN